MSHGEAANAWTDARIALLRQLWDEGASYAQITAALGGVSRNAVIGKVHRLRLPQLDWRRRAATSPGSAPGGGAVRRPIAARRAHRRSPPAPAAIALDQFNAAIPIEQRRTLLLLTRSTCRWPVGEQRAPEFFFCGGRVEAGRPYCPGHCGFAYHDEENPCRQFSSAKPGRRTAANPGIAPSRLNSLEGKRS